MNKESYIVVVRTDLQNLMKGVREAKVEGYITCGGFYCIPGGNYFQAMEKPDTILMHVDEIKESKWPGRDGSGISFIGNYVENTTGNYFTKLPLDLQEWLNSRENCVRGVTDHLEPAKQYKVTVLFEEVKS